MSAILENMKRDLEAARARTVPDVLPAVGAPFDVLFCGINPGLYSAATGHHFARPGNRFWPALHASGFTPRLLAPGEQDEIAGWGLGITNIAPRATAQAAELTTAELVAGGARLLALAERSRPRFLAIAGVTAYRTAFGQPRAGNGPQPDPLGPARLWVVPNPSGLNAHFSLDAIAAAFRELREAADAEERRGSDAGGERDDDAVDRACSRLRQPPNTAHPRQASVHSRPGAPGTPLHAAKSRRRHRVASPPAMAEGLPWGRTGRARPSQGLRSPTGSRPYERAALPGPTLFWKDFPQRSAAGRAKGG